MLTWALLMPLGRLSEAASCDETSSSGRCCWRDPDVQHNVELCSQPAARAHKHARFSGCGLDREMRISPKSCVTYIEYREMWRASRASKLSVERPLNSQTVTPFAAGAKRYQACRDFHIGQMVAWTRPLLPERTLTDCTEVCGLRCAVCAVHLWKHTRRL